MKLSKKLEAEILRIYHTYWDAYLKGDIKTFTSYFDHAITVFGTANGEVFTNKKAAEKFYKATAHQMSGKAEMRKRKIAVKVIGNAVLIYEQFDLYVLAQKKWMFYGHVRLTSMMEQKNGSWKVVLQHASFPDTRTEEGDQIATEKIKTENLQLREAVKRRTVELVEKNRELEIETALEKVRSIAMSMKDRVDMLKICKTISLQLAKLGIRDIRNVQTAIFNVPKGTYMNYEYYARHDKTFITETTYTDHKVARAFAAKMLKGKGEVSITYIKGREKVKEWLNYQKGTNVFIDTYLNTATSLTYYWYSLGPVALGVSTYTPLTKDEQGLFSRFLKVFELAYRRYLDIEKAEAQAKEAQIEASLEKVRAQALGMHKPEELTNICEVLFKELKQLGFTELRNSMINIHDDDKKTFVNYDYSDEIGKSITPLYYNIHPVIKKQIKQIRSADDAFSETVFKGRDLASWKAFRKSRGEKEDKRIKNSTALYYYFYSIGTGSIGISTFNAINEEKQELLKRFRNVFVFAHRRYMDVAQAEAQAREAQIEAALERVRAASMAMQDSSALSGIIYKLYGELTKLDAKLDRCFIMIVNPENKGITWWMAGQEGLLAENGFFVQMNQHPSHLMYLDNCKRRKKKWTYLFEGKEKRDWDRFGFSKTELARLPEPVKKFMASAKKVHLSGSSDQFGSLVTGSFEPLPEEQQDIISRFAIAFNQAYIRFLDLQKAEAQAREAKIEAALERVRSRTMAMHQTSELQEVIHTVHNELLNLNLSIDGGSFVVINDDVGPELRCWGSGGTANTSEEVQVPHFNMPFCTDLIKDIKKGPGFFTEEFSQNEKKKYFTKLFEHKPWSDISSEQKKETLSGSGGYTRSVAVSKHTSIFIINHHGRKFTEGENDILKRFAKAFEQTYTRFLDLQKAEAQAREAKIEAALERVRSRSLAMHKSEELLEIVTVIFEQLRTLGLQLWNCGIIRVHSKQSSDAELWMTRPDGKMMGQSFVMPLDKVPVYKKLYEAWKNMEEFHNESLQGMDIINHHNSIASLNVIPVDKMKQAAGRELPRQMFFHGINFSDGILGVITTEAVEDETLLLRFGNTFKQSYTRFLDLQKAEAQAREAEIEVALERVRAASMAMHNSKELVKVATTLYQQLISLGFDSVVSGGFNFPDEVNNIQKCWLAVTESGIMNDFAIKLSGDTVLDERIEFRRNNIPFLEQVLNGGEVGKHLDFLFPPDQDTPEIKASKDAMPVPTVFSIRYLKEGYMILISTATLSEEQKSIMERFASVFNLAYTRFLDLQKAEAQAREARIEAALEKVRSRSLAMHKSDELHEIVKVVFEKLNELEIGLGGKITIALTIFNKGQKELNFWAASEDFTNTISLLVPYHDDPIINGLWNAKESGVSYSAKIYDFEEKNKYWKWALENTNNKFLPADRKKLLLESESYAQAIALAKQSGIYVHSHSGNLPTEKETEILIRFANVFDQSYTRFLDLQKAEAQAREAEIELALERVRARTMAMHQSEELREVIELVYEQLVTLRLPVEHAGFILDYKERNDMHIWFASKQVQPSEITIPYFDSPHWNSFLEAKAKGENFFSNSLDSKVKNRFYKDLFKWIPPLPDEAVNAIFSRPGLIISTVLLENVGLYIENYTQTAFTGDENAILMRFGKVFQQTYTRFLDLQKAEAQAREAKIEASLERVRSKAMAMHSSGDLAITVDSFFGELQSLHITPRRCGVTLIDKESRIADLTVTTATEDGETKKVIAKLKLSGHPVLDGVYDHWKKQTEFHPVLQGADIKAYYQVMNPQVAFPDFAEDEKQYGHYFFFTEGGVFAWTDKELEEDALKIFRRFTSVLSLTYKRYKDLQQAEKLARQAEQDLIKLKEEKKKTEEALTELQITQKQLIQSEKMASLGELTAGIAHEIQNPLNFVNNFSEVSKELLDEMKEAIEKGDAEEAKEIMNDVIQNLEKINHHGKRADGIVKGMLQHSRSSSNQKEPTDINALADEYLRLAYHGLRAKDKTFNATMKTEFDESIGNINIIPQDIGRVILNLITNAFYVVNEKSKQNIAGYEPTVTVKTSKIPPSGGRGAEVLISVKDNGNGIPQKILDKIFQPFFTTKPTGQGTGLGLSLSYDIVKAHGGELKVQTKEGEGSEFIIELPV
ncbi:MAG: nuclear transport factor 2 family protein [Chitinophagaceae bacterium]|nr:nuclear transport factor 2 family protein [Chitinophagaceae bacterium]